MDRNEIGEKVIKALSLLTKDEIQLTSDLVNDLSLSSLELLLLSTNLEGVFNVKISESEIGDAEIVDDIVTIVDNKIK